MAYGSETPSQVFPLLSNTRDGQWRGRFSLLVHHDLLRTDRCRRSERRIVCAVRSAGFVNPGSARSVP